MDDDSGHDDWDDSSQDYLPPPPPPPHHLPPPPPPMQYPPGTYSGGPMDGCIVLSPDQVKLLQCLGRIVDNKAKQKGPAQAKHSFSSRIPTRRRSVGDFRGAGRDATDGHDRQTDGYIISDKDFSTLFSAATSIVSTAKSTNIDTHWNDPWSLPDPFAGLDLSLHPPAPPPPFPEGDALGSSVTVDPVAEMNRILNDLLDQGDVPAAMAKIDGATATENLDTTAHDQVESKEACMMSKLPKETLASIFKYARAKVDGQRMAYKAAKKRWQNKFNESPDFEESPPAEFKMSSQAWLLSMRLVCKTWAPVAQSVAWARLDITNDKILTKVLAVLDDKPELATIVGEAIIKMRPSPRGRQDPDLDWDYPAPIAAGAGNVDQENKKTPEAKVAKFVEIATTLHRLKLITKGNGHNRPPSFVAFMNDSLCKALCGSSLTSLWLDQPVVFADLELLLLRVKSLQILVLDSGVDNVDGRDDVTTEEHQARLKHIKIRSFSGKIRSGQLSWILRPSVGYLSKLYLTLPSRVVPFGDIGEFNMGPQMLPQAFACATFANLLVQLAPTLHILELETSGGNTTIADDLHAEPHMGNLDYALGHITGLRKVRIPWALTSTGFLDAMAGSPNLTEMTMLGNATSTSARDIMNRIEAGSFPKLKKITLLLFRMAMVNEGWNIRDIRALLTFMKDRELELVFA